MKKKIYLILIGSLLMCVNLFAQTITAYEYWFDTNFAGRTIVNASGGAVTQINSSINTGSLAMGYHTLTFRTQGSDGKWSVPVSRSFVNGSNMIERVEYWFDDDYTTKTYQTLESGPGGNYSLPLIVSGLSTGTHKITMCFEDAGGIRSVPVSASFNNVSSIGVNEINGGSGITIFPNPAKNDIHLSGIDGYTNIIVADIGGRIVLQKPVNRSSDAQLDIRHLDPGVYTVILSTDSGNNASMKFVITE